MENFLLELMRRGDLLPVIAIVGGLTVGAIWIIAATWHSTVTARAKQSTKREIAAYVAEGTMDPKTAVALIQAGEKSDDVQAVEAAVAAVKT
ncbi:MAG: hypothetical protein GY715_18695 [Planctomycetes bacterium]|nr:hypothetical protein [Planctomycetota bacterium]